MARSTVTLIVAEVELEARRNVAGAALAPLAASLRAELERLLREGFHVPHEKALLSRTGGRCERDGIQLRFDPFSPQKHVCPQCGAVFERERDYLWWITSYQLWLAERTVYAATLFTLTGERNLAELAERILDELAARYLQYPNRDNALGPTRPFFSTYLESIWLIQIAVALSLLENGGAAALGERVRDRVIEPSARLIESFDEGASNRQVWNSAALLAAGRLLGDSGLVERSILGPAGLTAHLARGLLPDGSWYEGENYHVFAHRGLWYGVTMAEQAGYAPPRELVSRFEEGFAFPLITALPDLTIPSRRDSPYAISLRQWRFAESFELGLGRRGDDRLAAALGRLYGDPGPRRDTGRWRSAADTQPHEEASALTRADLGWRALLFAPATLPDAPETVVKSVVLEEQGYAVFRRNGGETYVALDYGHSGGGHGHPDRLNLLLAKGDNRILDDYGTGSYVDPSLHWYRSTLAHNAPLFDGTSQRRASGRLLAHEERDAAGWVDADVPLNGLASIVRARRSVVVMTDYLVDRLEWESSDQVRAELPIHVLADATGLELHTAALDGGPSPDDGFSFVRDTARAELADDAVVELRHCQIADVAGWICPSGASEWWRAVGPGPPGRAERPFWLVRLVAEAGSITSVWSWTSAVTGVDARDGLLIVHRGDQERHEHARRDSGWSVTLHRGRARSSIDLGGQRRRTESPSVAYGRPPVTTRKPLRVRSGQPPIAIQLGEQSYRRSEESWDEANRPSARVSLSATAHHLILQVSVEKGDAVFRAADAADPELDNEHPDIHSDGVQLYVATSGHNREAAWLAVPEYPAPRVRIRNVAGARSDIPLGATWKAGPRGYSMRFEIPLETLGPEREIPAALDLIVNEMAPDRVRRRGQLVLSGGGGWTYLQGDRQSPGRFIPIVVERD